MIGIAMLNLIFHISYLSDMGRILAYLSHCVTKRTNTSQVRVYKLMKTNFITKNYCKMTVIHWQFINIQQRYTLFQQYVCIIAVS